MDYIQLGDANGALGASYIEEKGAFPNWTTDAYACNE